MLNFVFISLIFSKPFNIFPKIPLYPYSSEFLPWHEIKIVYLALHFFFLGSKSEDDHTSAWSEEIQKKALVVVNLASPF